VRWKISFLLSFTIFLLFGCSLSTQEVKEATLDVIEKAFQEEPIKSNQTIDNISFYLPKSIEIESSSGNNIILSEGNQQYILFINKNEEKTSDLLYQKGLDSSVEIIIDETKVTENEYKYTIVNKLSDDTYEVIAGLGGAKITTLVESQDVAESVQKMIDIIQSVQY